MARNASWSRLGLLLGSLLSAGCASLPAGWPSLPIPGGAPPVANMGAVDSPLSLARLSERHNQPENAERIYQAVLQKDPRNQVAHHRLGVIAAKNGELEKAQQLLQTASTLGPTSPELLNDIGYNLYRMNRLSEAEAMFRRVLEMSPQHQGAHNNLALVLGASGRYPESLAEFRKVVGDAEAYANLAFIKTQRGDYDSAEADYHRAVTLDSDLRPAAEALVQLSKFQATRRKLSESPITVAQKPAEQKPNPAQVAAAAPKAEAETKKEDRSQLPAFFEVIERPKGKPTATVAAAPAKPSAVNQSRTPKQAVATTAAPRTATKPAAGNEPREQQVTAVPPATRRAPATGRKAAPGPFVPAKIVFGPLRTPVKESSELDGDVQPAAAQDLDQSAVVAAVHETEVAEPSPGPRLPVTNGAPSPLELPQLTAPLQSPLASAEQGLAPIITPGPKKSTSRTKSEPAAPDAEPTGPVLLPPLNHWQKPTWTPDMSSFRPALEDAVQTQLSDTAAGRKAK